MIRRLLPELRECAMQELAFCVRRLVRRLVRNPPPVAETT